LLKKLADRADNPNRFGLHGRGVILGAEHTLNKSNTSRLLLLTVHEKLNGLQKTVSHSKSTIQIAIAATILVEANNLTSGSIDDWTARASVIGRAIVL